MTSTSDETKMTQILVCSEKGCTTPAVDEISGRRLCKDHCEAPAGHIVVVFGDKKFFGEIVPFEGNEVWQEYKLQDGSQRVLRVKHLVKRVVRLVGHKGDDGIDTYTFLSDLVSDVQPRPTTSVKL